MNEQPTGYLAYRFEYADESAFEVYVDGRAFIVTKSGRREEKFGKITNNIPLLLGRIAKPRQDKIDRLQAALEDIQKEAMTMKPPRHTWYYDRAQNALNNSTDPLVRDGLAPLPRS